MPDPIGSLFRYTDNATNQQYAAAALNNLHKIHPAHPMDSFNFTNAYPTASASNSSSQSTSTAGTTKRKRSWSRAVFSQLQRKGLEIQFQIQKYITKPDRRKLAARLGLTDAQVIIESNRIIFCTLPAFIIISINYTDHCFSFSNHAGQGMVSEPSYEVAPHSRVAQKSKQSISGQRRIECPAIQWIEGWQQFNHRWRRHWIILHQQWWRNRCWHRVGKDFFTRIITQMLKLVLKYDEMRIDRERNRLCLTEPLI